ncbi:putative restriction endonuclease [Halogranum rubrum]|uniref:Putative restriction endonuclease n=1 Tax=Halogranum rubrum TaxID=553466 RepID=A0A1I4E4V0_9EURY|nr:HNH endonuclease [Halogranum rubrum]SFL00858.1 putative restriction endonuclease [Halogranum rubrum]
MSDVGNVFLAPCSNAHAQKHLRDTVIDGVGQSLYRKFTEREFGDRVAVWGASPGADKYIEQMRHGDVILFYTGNQRYQYAAKVVTTEYNPKFAAMLWTDYDLSLRDNMDDLWPYVMYLSDVQEVDIDSTEIHHKHAGHSRGHPQNFMRLNDGGRRSIVREYGSVSAFVDHTAVEDHSDEYDDAESELYERVQKTPELTEDEAQYTEAYRRARSSAFRRGVKRAYDNHCAICGAKRFSPTGRPEVEAAHIYPRSQNGREDIRNGLALCKLHHWAFDNGWLSVRDRYEVLVNERPELPGYDEFVQLREKPLCLPEREDLHPAKMYLQEHRALHGFSAD